MRQRIAGILIFAGMGIVLFYTSGLCQQTGPRQGAVVGKEITVMPQDEASPSAPKNKADTIRVDETIKIGNIQSKLQMISPEPSFSPDIEGAFLEHSGISQEDIDISSDFLEAGQDLDIPVAPLEEGVKPSSGPSDTR